MDLEDPALTNLALRLALIPPFSGCWFLFLALKTNRVGQVIIATKLHLRHFIQLPFCPIRSHAGIFKPSPSEHDLAQHDSENYEDCESYVGVSLFMRYGMNSKILGESTSGALIPPLTFPCTRTREPLDYPLARRTATMSMLPETRARCF